MQIERPTDFLGGGSYSPQYVNKQRRSWKPKTNVDSSALPSMFAAAARVSPPRTRYNKPQTLSPSKPVIAESAQAPSMFPIFSAAPRHQETVEPAKTTVETGPTTPSTYRNTANTAMPVSAPATGERSNPTTSLASLSIAATKKEAPTFIMTIAEKKMRAERPPIELKYLPKDDEERSRDRPALNIPYIDDNDIHADHVLEVLAMVNKESVDDLASIASVETSPSAEDDDLTGWDRIMKDKIDNFLGSHHSIPSNYSGASDDESGSDSDSDSGSYHDDDDEYSF